MMICVHDVEFNIT